MNFNESVCDKTVGSLFKRLRQICSVSLDKQNLELGGMGKIVEIDESMYAKVKHWVGKDLKRAQFWVFGLVERSDLNGGKSYMEVFNQIRSTGQDVDSDSDSDKESEVGSVAGSLGCDIEDCFGNEEVDDLLEEVLIDDEDERTIDAPNSVISSTVTDTCVNDETDDDDINERNINFGQSVKTKLDYYERKSRECVNYSSEIEEAVSKVVMSSFNAFLEKFWLSTKIAAKKSSILTNLNSDLNFNIGQNGVSRFSTDNWNQILGQDQNVPLIDRQPCLCAQPKFAKAFLRDLNELQSVIVSAEVYNQTNDDSFEVI
ncbi:hypothetical protein BpHYR1_005438 [Brachionus plicatilis]|uniref:Uncharacterized protein n=1 Tax=Brachionus plicatilis TaxID=10195 RepID=A0A3M7Q2E1_BRAPC|nr:hypothetical protein BpHYR1_005438 [Brachionus plicatilis]